jgi:HPt (histidine-containing phosphotransfer) domain-containing protein
LIQKYLPPSEPSPKQHREKNPALPAEPEVPVHNRAVLMERVDGDEELCQELIEIYLEESPLQIAEIKDAYAQHDQERLMRVAHTLKGASAHIAAPVVMGLAKEIEFAAREGNFEKAAEFFEQLHEAFNAVETVLKGTGS